METFTLIVWIMMGMRFEETRIENLGWRQCFEPKMTIEGDHAHKLGKCVRAAPVAPMICGIAGCCAFISPGGVLNSL